MTTRLVRPLLLSKILAQTVRPHSARVPALCFSTSTLRTHINSTRISLTSSNLSSKWIPSQALSSFPSGKSVLSGVISRALLNAKTISSTFPHYFSSTPYINRSPLLHDVLAKFSFTRPGAALRNTYYSRIRSSTPIRTRSGGSSGGNGKNGGFGPWQQVKAFINALPSGVIVWTIIAANGLVFLAWQYAGNLFQQFRDPKMLQWMYQNFTTSWENLRQGRFWTLLTSCFSHSSSGHILMNLLTFYFFAPLGASILGNVPFLGLYLGGAIASSAISIVWNQFWRKDGRPLPSHGASGGINAVLAFFACAFPTATVYVFFVVPLPAWAAIGGLIGWDFYLVVV